MGHHSGFMVDWARQSLKVNNEAHHRDSDIFGVKGGRELGQSGQDSVCC